MRDRFHPIKMHVDCENLISWYFLIRRSDLEIVHTFATVKISRSFLMILYLVNVFTILTLEWFIFHGA